MFHKAVTMVDIFSILGDSPSKEVNDRFMLWWVNRSKEGKWTLPGVAESVYTIAKHIHDDLEKR